MIGSTVFVLRDFDPQWTARPPDETALLAQVGSGRTAWILQTWARLRQAGWSVGLAGELPRHGLAILHADDFAAFDRLTWPAGLWLAICRADRPPTWRADFEIVQNPLQADGQRTFYAQHWTHPGLLPRDTRRGATLVNVGYFGMSKHLPEPMRSPSWTERLRHLGLNWVAPDATGLHDYRQIDAVVALRHAEAGSADHKPPTKLLNAWLAGVPALVGPESAFRALRTDPLDFIEVHDPEEVVAGLQRLRADAELYAAMRRRARERAAAVAPAANTARWHQLLADALPARQESRRARCTHFLRRHARGGQRLYLRLNRRRFHAYDSA